MSIKLFALISWENVFFTLLSLQTFDSIHFKVNIFADLLAPGLKLASFHLHKLLIADFTIDKVGQHISRLLKCPCIHAAHAHLHVILIVRVF